MYRRYWWKAYAYMLAHLKVEVDCVGCTFPELTIVCTHASVLYEDS